MHYSCRHYAILKNTIYKALNENQIFSSTDLWCQLQTNTKQSEPQTWLKRLGSKTDLNWDKNLIAKIILLGMLKGINAALAEGSGKGEEEAITAQDDDFVSRRVAVEYLEGKPFRFRRGGV